ncbi:MAG TPA: type II secretion system F family protein [Isosphaeraceae bacterium]
MSGSTSGAVSVDQLIALSDEMAALIRAGVPLDRGLVAAGRDLRGRVGGLAAQLGARIESGEGLAEALEAGGAPVPAFYRAVVDAGLRSGRLAKALEGLASYARAFAETRRAIGLAMLYPLLVLLLAYGLFVVFVMWVVPRLAATFTTMGLPGMGVLDLFLWLGDHLAYWVWIVPALLILLTIGWAGSGRAMALRPGRLVGVLRFVPGMTSILRLAQTADFADLLALMIEHGVPLDEAAGLAAEATGSPGLRASVRVLADSMRRGDPADEAAGRGGLPPMLAWVIATAGARGPLAPALRHAAATYRARAARKAETLQAILPSAVLVVVGIAAGSAYALSVFKPVITLWYQLAMPVSD